MKPHIKLNITVGTFANMTCEQFWALQDKVLKEGMWETYNEPTLRIDGGEYLGVYLDRGFFLGIEKDGYTHS